MKKTHDDFREPKVASVFLGEMTSEEEIDDYLLGNFSTDFGFAIDEDDGPEFEGFDSPREIAALLDGFSWCDSFGGAAVQAAELKGIKEANCAVVFYNFRYDPQAVDTEEDSDPDQEPQLTFIGAFKFGK